jgi:hypothetical protein
MRLREAGAPAAEEARPSSSCYSARNGGYRRTRKWKFFRRAYASVRVRVLGQDTIFFAPLKYSPGGAGGGNQCQMVGPWYTLDALPGGTITRRMVSDWLLDVAPFPTMKG